MGTTQPDGLPYPSDYSTPADAPAAYQALAEATQVALTNRDTAHAPTGHGHNPSGVGIRSDQIIFGSIGAGEEQLSGPLGRNVDERIFLTVNHPSTYIMCTVTNITVSTFEIKVRNTTTGKTHTNIAIPYLLVRFN